MRFVTIYIILFTAALNAAPIENVTSSAVRPMDVVDFNLDFIDPFGIPLYDIIINAKTGTGVYSDTLEHMTEPQYLNTYEGSIDFPVRPTGVVEFYGRVDAETLLATQSFKNASNQFPPAENLYANLAPDAIGDTMPGSFYGWLDLTGTAATYSDTRLYTKLSNVNGTWPTNQGWTTYFVYGMFISNPDSFSVSALALIYGNVPLLLTPGLYRVNLADTSFSRISSISSQVSGSSLHMACNISDIISDPMFPTWPPESGHIWAGAFTLTINVGTPGFNDFTYPASYIPKSQFLNADGNTDIQLTSLGFDIIPGVSLNTHINYFDADNNLPVLREFWLDNVLHEMGSFDHSYVDTSTFNSMVEWPGFGAHFYVIRFYDGEDTLVIADTLFLDPSGTDNDNLPSGFELAQNYPNPFNANTLISFSLDRLADIELFVYDAVGREISKIAEGTFEAGTHAVPWDGLNGSGKLVSTGVYYYRLFVDGKQSHQKKMVFIK